MAAELEEKVRASLVEGGIPCKSAWEIAGESGLSKRDMGSELNNMEIRCYDCQLGAFGAEKATHQELEGREVNRTIADKIEASVIDGRLPCAVAFKIAETLQVVPREVGDTATQTKIKFNKCQLGFFP